MQINESRNDKSIACVCDLSMEPFRGDLGNSFIFSYEITIQNPVIQDDLSFDTSFTHVIAFFLSQLFILCPKEP